LNSQKKNSNDKQKELKQRLIESEKKYQHILENANDLIILLNKKFEVEYINLEVYRKLIERIKEDSINKFLSNIIHPEDLKNVIKELKRAFTKGTGKGAKYEYRFKNLDGNYIWVEISGRTFVDTNGEKKLLLIIRDINERKIAEQKLIKSDKKLKELNIELEQKVLERIKELQESEERYRLIAEHAYDFIAIINRKFEFEYINEEPTLKYMGYRKEEVIGKFAIDFLHPDDIEQAVKSLNIGFKAGKGIGIVRFKHKKGHWVWLEVKGRSFIDKEGNEKGIVISRDITERKQVEELLKKSEKQYREAYNLANFYRDLFAHDINNIFQNILSSKELCSQYLNDPEKLKDISIFLNIISEQVRRGAKLIRNVQKLSKLRDTKIVTQSIEVYTVLKKAIEYIKNSFKERKIDIKIEDFTEKMFVQANDLLIDVFENILNNAVRHNESPSVEILIKCSRMQKRGLKYLKIEFIDNGLGISDKRKEMIFKRVYKKDISIGGMGLGLSLVNKIIVSYNGEICVEDRVQGDYLKGSNFIILIPEVK